MSRTFRRTNAHGIQTRWYKEGETVLIADSAQSHVLVYFSFRYNLWKKRTNYVEAVLEGKLLAKYNAIYHSDKTETMYNSPKWYRQCRNRKLRSKQRMALKRCRQYDDYDDYADPKFVKDDWYSW